MAEGELEGLDFLRPEARKAVGQVRTALQLLACCRAVAAIHRDEKFQEDAAEPRVQKAIEEIRDTNSFEKYSRDGQVSSVMGKLRKLQSVLRDNGGMKVALEDLLPGKGGATLQGLIAQDTIRIAELEEAHSLARAAAIDALLSLPPGTTAARAREGASGAAGPQGADGGGKGRAEDEEDEFAGVQRGGGKRGKEKSGAKGAGAAAAVRVEAAAGEEPDGGLEEPLWKRQMKQAAKDTLHRIIRITLLFAFVMGLTWLLGMQPSQQAATGEMERRLEELQAAAMAHSEQLLAEQQATAVAGEGPQNVEL